jgi:hypothetical protein
MNEHFSQCANPKALTTRDVGFVESPEYKAGMALFDQNFQDFRRTSNEARYR